MLNRKIAISLTLMGLTAANVALALPEFTTNAPESSVNTCIAEVSSNADYTNAVSILHKVETEDRRISGHQMNIQTLVYGEDGVTLIREYKAKCAINGKDEIQRFRIRQKGA